MRQIASKRRIWNPIESPNHRRLRIRFRTDLGSSSSANGSAGTSSSRHFQPGSPAHSAQYLNLPARKQVTLHDLPLYLNVKTCKACQHPFAFAFFRKTKFKNFFEKFKVQTSFKFNFQHTTPLVERSGINPNRLQKPKFHRSVKH